MENKIINAQNCDVTISIDVKPKNDNRTVRKVIKDPSLFTLIFILLWSCALFYGFDAMSGGKAIAFIVKENPSRESFVFSEFVAFSSAILAACIPIIIAKEFHTKYKYA